MYVNNNQLLWCKVNVCTFKPPLEDLWEDSHSRKSPPDSEKKESKSEVPSMPIPDVHSVGGVLVHMPHVCSVRKVVTSDTYTISIKMGCYVVFDICPLTYLIDFLFTYLHYY